MKSTYSFIRSAMAAAAVASVAAGSAALALPAFAASGVVTGYETGYSYHQGLANGSGAALMAADNGGSTQTSGVTGTGAAPATTDVSSAQTGQTTELPATANSAVVPATQPAQQVAVSPVAPSFIATLAALPVTTWAAIGLIALALILALLVLATPRETVTRTTRTYQYR